MGADLVASGAWEAPAPVHGVHQSGSIQGIDQAAALRALAVRVIERAMMDARGRTGISKSDRRQHAEAVQDARQWIKEGGREFVWWAEAAGLEAGRLHRALSERAGDPLRSFPPGAPTKTCRNSADPDCHNGPMKGQTHG